jgi:hypothetical protein
MPDLSTVPHAIVRVLLRPAPLVDSARQRKVGAHLVMITGKATAKKWPGAKLKADELEGIVWTTAADAPDVVEALRDDPAVIDAIFEISDEPESR